MRVGGRRGVKGRYTEEIELWFGVSGSASEHHFHVIVVVRKEAHDNVLVLSFALTKDNVRRMRQFR